jgi:hypothetical protein
MLTRHAAETAIDEIRDPLINTPHYNNLAGVVRALCDGYPLSDAQSALDAAAYAVPDRVIRAIRAILNDTQGS